MLEIHEAPSSDPLNCECLDSAQLWSMPTVDPIFPRLLHCPLLTLGIKIPRWHDSFLCFCKVAAVAQLLGKDVFGTFRNMGWAWSVSVEIIIFIYKWVPRYYVNMEIFIKFLQVLPNFSARLWHTLLKGFVCLRNLPWIHDIILISQVFQKRLPPEAVDLVCRFFQYSPNLRCTAVSLMYPSFCFCFSILVLNLTNKIFDALLFFFF